MGFLTNIFTAIEFSNMKANETSEEVANAIKTLQKAKLNPKDVTRDEFINALSILGKSGKGGFLNLALLSGNNGLEMFNNLFSCLDFASLGVSAYENRKDVKIFKQGFSSGYDKGKIDTAKKFAEELERNDNFRIAAFALGNHIAKLSGNQSEKLDMIVYTLGHPGSNILSGYVRSENKKIIDNPPAFYEIKNKYLSKLNSEQLRLIDKFLKDVVEAGDYNSACSNFYNNDWKNYLNWRS